MENSFSMEQVLQMFAAMNKQNQENLLEAIKELKKPSPEEQAKLDKDKAKLLERVTSAALLAKATEEGKRNAARNCPHGTTHPGTKAFTHQWRAQVHTPSNEKAYYEPRCTQCGSTWNMMPEYADLPSGKILASNDQLQGGVGLDQYGERNIEQLFRWAAQQIKAGWPEKKELAVA